MQTAAGDGGVGIVVVSHSRPLARAAVALAAEMVHGRSFRVAVAAGLDESTFGTDAVRIKSAIEEMDGPHGVVVLMDLGSAVLSAELALDLLDDQDARERVILCPAPLVEGLVVAAVAAAGGAGAAEVAAEARAALMGKTAHLSSGSELEPGSEPAAAASAEVVATFTVENEHGLHARPAARLVSEVRGLDAVVRVRNLTTGSAAVSGSSLSRVATLAALHGHQVEVSASGPQATEAVEHVLALASRRFDEPLAPHAAGLDGVPAADPDRPATDGRLQPASAGIGIGPVCRIGLESPSHQQDPHAADPPAAQWRRVVEAVAEVRREIERLRAVAAREVGTEEAGIFDAHLMLLGDAELLADVKRRVNAGEAAAAAWAGCIKDVEMQWAALPDPYLRARAEDVRAVGDQVLRSLVGVTAVRRTAAGVVVARSLTPADVAELDRDKVDAIVMVGGSPTSHVAILARAQGIPAVVGAGRELLALEEGTVLVVDGTAGTVVVDPPPDVLLKYRAQAAELTRVARLDLAEAARRATTRDGVPIEVAANIGSVADARSALAAGADSVGLLRTEFLFLGRERAPEVGEQEREYRAVAAALAGRAVTVRTLDVGGDKPLAYIPMPKEENPFLGLRGIRLALERPQLLADQLEALCRTAVDHPVSVMFPMVSTVDELVRARQALTDAAGPGGPPAGLRVGMMVEVPAAALSIASFLPYLDFVSIGTHDLTQYTLAAERGNAAVSGIGDALDPAVLRLVAMVCRAATGRVPVAVCGEAAADELAVPILLGLGVSELSVAPRSVPAVKRAVRNLDLLDCGDVAARALEATGPGQVRALVRSMLSAARGTAATATAATAVG
jgi:phosphocarrier protein FPr